MRTRDTGILLVSVLAIFLGLETGNEFQVKRKWSLELKPTLYRNGRYAAPDERLPKPIVDDLDGDGVNEIIVATRDPKIKVLDPQHPFAGLKGVGRGSEEIALRMKAETTLLSKGVGNVRSGRQPVAMATGFIHPAEHRNRHKVVVVLTHDWTVLCFDRHLKLLWESNPMKVKVAHAFHKEASISITPSKLRPFDEGLVVVGASMEYEGHNRLHRRKPRKDKDAKGKEGEGGGEKQAQRNRIKQMLGLPVKANSGDEWEEDDDKLEETLQHFNYFAFDGRRGALRWSHKSGDFLPSPFDQEVTVPQHNYKLELHKESKHAGEVDWRQYRNSVLNTLPHQWRSKEDTRIYTSHFARRLGRDFDRDKRNADAAHAREVGLFSSSDPVKGAGKASRSGTRAEGRKMSKSAKRAAVRDRRARRKAGAGYGGADKKANVLVTHREAGLEVLHLHTGRPVTELQLPRGMAHADINGDGAIDRVEAVIGAGVVIRPEGHRVSDVDMRSCYAWVTTGTPPTHALYNETICSANSPLRAMIKSITSVNRGRNAEEGTKLLAAPPVVIPRHAERDVLDRNVETLDALFLVSDGLLSSFASTGLGNWQLQTPAFWVQPVTVRVEGSSAEAVTAGFDRGTIEMQMHPVLEPMKLKLHDRRTHILAIGMGQGVVVSEDGDIVAEFNAPSPPTGPVVIADFDNDGWNDVIMQTRTAFIGLGVRPTKHRKPLTTVVGGLLLLLAAVLLSHVLNEGAVLGRGAPGQRRRGKKQGRATD